MPRLTATRPGTIGRALLLTLASRVVVPSRAAGVVGNTTCLRAAEPGGQVSDADQRIAQRDGPWAVVTGASDGIGLAGAGDHPGDERHDGAPGARHRHDRPPQAHSGLSRGKWAVW